MKDSNKVVRRSRKPISPIPKRRKPNRKLGINLGEKNGQWQGDSVVYLSLHEWVRNHLPKAGLCEKCSKVPPYDLANIDGKYTRDLNTWQWLCRGCHMLSDGRFHSRDNKTGKFISRQEQEIMVTQ